MSLKPFLVKGLTDFGHVYFYMTTSEEKSSMDTVQLICTIFKYVVLSSLFVKYHSVIFQNKFLVLSYYIIRVVEYSIVNKQFYVEGCPPENDHNQGLQHASQSEELYNLCFAVANVMFARDLFGIYSSYEKKSILMMILCISRIAIYIAMYYTMSQMALPIRIIVSITWVADIITCDYKYDAYRWISKLNIHPPCQKVLLGFNFTCQNCVEKSDTKEL